MDPPESESVDPRRDRQRQDLSRVRPGASGVPRGLSAWYVRAPRLFEELSLCHADGTFRKRLAAIAKIQLVIIDDFAISPIGPRERNDLLELLDDRVGSRASILTSQLPIEHWHEYLNDPTLADAIMDRLIHCSHKIHLQGKESMRKRTSKKAGEGLNDGQAATPVDHRRAGSSARPPGGQTPLRLPRETEERRGGPESRSR